MEINIIIAINFMVMEDLEWALNSAKTFYAEKFLVYEYHFLYIPEV